LSIKAKFNILRPNFSLDVDLNIPNRGVTSLFGPSGCGKTTLLRAIAGLDRYKQGFLKVGDTIWQDENQFIPTFRRSLGYVFQEASLFSHLTVKGNLEYGLKRIPDTGRRIPLDNTIELLGIGELLERKADTLSGGEQHRVAIARALAVSPKLLLMDEPLTGLDQDSKKEILPYLESLCNELEIPIIYVSHTIEEIARLADHLLLMEAGRINATGSITEMLTRLDLPLTSGNDAAAIIKVTVTEHNEDFHLTHLDFDGGCFSVPRNSLKVGSKVKLRLAARDVSLTLERQTGTSIQNIFPATVDEITTEDTSRVMVKLIAGGVPILSRITKKSLVELDLKPGKVVYAQVKSVVLLI